jgi:hypothetical protein
MYSSSASVTVSFFRRAAADFQRLVEQLVIQGEVGGHLYTFPHMPLV